MIQFKVSAITTLTPEEIVQGMFEQKNWSTFKGAGPVPGIKEVDIVKPKDSVVGTLFKVKNTDGSHHDEKIVDYIPGQSLVMKLENFSAPLNKFASHFYETWTFDRRDRQTYFERNFDLYPRNVLGRIMLRIIAFYFKKALKDHSELIATEESLT